MTVNFEKLNPSQLKKAAIVPQVLDNQWIPRSLLSKMIKKGKKLDDVAKERKKHILKEWRRALVYGEQVVVNRAFMFNNSVVVDDYDDSENRQQFKQLLNSGVIALYLLGEDNPDQKPRFQVDDRLWNAWLEIVNDSHGVDPLKWTVVGLGKGAKKCPRVIQPILRNFANKSWNWSGQVGHRMSWQQSSSPPHRPFATGSNSPNWIMDRDETD